MAFCHCVVSLGAWLHVSMCVALVTTHWKSLEVTETIEMNDIGTNT